MIISATLSKPTNETEALLGKPYEKIKIKAENAGGKTKYFAEFFTKTQVTHRHFSEQELEEFLTQNVGKTFRNCVQRTETQEITFLSNKKGRLTRIAKDLDKNASSSANNKISNKSTIKTILFRKAFLFLF